MFFRRFLSHYCLHHTDKKATFALFSTSKDRIWRICCMMGNAANGLSEICNVLKYIVVYVF